MEQRKLNILNLIGYILMVGVNVLANTLPIAGRTTGDISDFIDNLFVPAGFTFSIWGVIYLLLGIFVIAPFFRSEKTLTEQGMARIGYLFFITCIINATWIVAWHYLQIGIAMILMLGLLITLLMVYLRLSKIEFPLNSLERYSIQLPFQIYSGWISVATIANMAGLLTFYGFSGGSIAPEVWTIGMISIATGLGIVMLYKFHDFAFPTVIAWALWGIYQKRMADTAADDSLIEVGIPIILSMLLLTMLLKFLRRIF